MFGYQKDWMAIMPVEINQAKFNRAFRTSLAAMEESMKKNLTMTLVVVSLVFASVLFVSAESSGILKVNVPFAFQVGQTSLPAGDYIVELGRLSNASALGTALIVRTADGKAFQRIGARPALGANNQASLTFNKYANTYFLANVDSYGIGCELNKSKAEKEIATRASAFQAVSVAAE